MAQAYTSEATDARPTFARPTAGRAGVAALFLLVALFVLAGVRSQQPPRAVGADAPAGEFSSARAVRRLEVIARQPHPVGTAEHAAVRDYILAELKAAGLAPELQTATGFNHEWEGPLRAGRVENIVARVKGTGGGRAVMMAAHYDSTPTGAGASDDGAAVAAMLEVLGALKAGPPLKNDLLLLFTDAEEAGLLGAGAFVREHPWAKDVAVVLNFEARGSGGPSVMFETSDENGWLVGEFAEAAPLPVAHSLSYEIYRLLPNDTDMTVFKKAGMSGLNFAYIDNPAHYHTALDNLARLDERSVQHHGANALALARHFGNLDLTRTRQSNAVYFDLLGLTVIHYPALWAAPLAAFALSALAFVVAVGLRRKRLSVAGMAFGVAALLSSVAASALFGWLAWKLVKTFDAAPGWQPLGETYQGDLYAVGLVGLAVAVTSAVYALFGRRVSAENLTVGGLLCWALLLVAAVVYVPGASYLLTWPLLFATMWPALRVASRDGRTGSSKLTLVLGLCAVPALVLVVPVIRQTFVGLTLEWVAAILSLIALLLGLLVPHLDALAAAAGRWALPSAAAALCVAMLLAGGVRSGTDAAQPKLDSIFYGLNADTGAGVWASLEDEPDEWTSQFFAPAAQKKELTGFFNANSSRRYLQSPAPAAPLAAPEVVVLDDTARGDARHLRLRLRSPRGASVLTLYVDSRAEITGAALDGRAFGEGGAHTSAQRGPHWSLRYYAPPAEGVELRLDLKAAEPLRLRLVDQSYGLPEFEGAPVKARPEGVVPAPVHLTDSTFVSRSFNL
ncbi:MAG TPA: M20/M25/M40 family metallo-hydrolase [Pyrinomonadaceae bacterium]|nr:M20/M25/M40 family metallo-hydrolase [Pyrinomonadaceae bacterium]